MAIEKHNLICGVHLKIIDKIDIKKVTPTIDFMTTLKKQSTIIETQIYPNQNFNIKAANILNNTVKSTNNFIQSNIILLFYPPNTQHKELWS
jgi:hypothetical protein